MNNCIFLCYLVPNNWKWDILMCQTKFTFHNYLHVFIYRFVDIYGKFIKITKMQKKLMNNYNILVYVVWYLTIENEIFWFGSFKIFRNNIINIIKV